MSHQFAKRWFSVGDYYQMAEVGILTEDDRVELIEGEVLEMSPIGSRHAACVKRLNTLLNQQVGHTAIVSVQDPIYIDDFSEPQPNVALLWPRADFYAEEHPRSSDVLLVIEVADTSVELDRNKKLPLYARTGISEMVIVVLPEEMIEMHAEPVDGRYQQVRVLRRGDDLESDTISHLKLSVDAILG